MSEATHSETAFRNQRLIPAKPQAVFAAFENPQSLARWWGPDGFTNTFEQFEFKPGGRWALVMHGPDGANYPNESRFVEIQPNARVVIEHTSRPWFQLTVTLTPQGDQTLLTWIQEFGDPKVAEQLRSICVPANEQNLDRLQALLATENH